MAVKVEMMIQVCINGRPIWRKSKEMKKQCSHLMTDKEYDKVLDAGIGELISQIKSSDNFVKTK